MGNHGDDDDSNDPPVQPDSPKLAQGVTITKVVLNQGVRHTLMDGGAASTNAAPVIANRPGIVRVCFETHSDYDGKEVNAVLSIGNEELSQNLVLHDSSVDGDMSSTINFSVPGDWLSP